MRQYTEKEKLNWLADWQTSGVSAKSFAKDKPFSVSSLRYWKRKFKSSSASSSFVQVIPELPKISPYAKLSYPSGITLEVYSPVSADYFKTLLT